MLTHALKARLFLVVFFNIILVFPVIADGTDSLRFDKPWQSPSQCGPVSLYFFLKLHGASVDSHTFLNTYTAPKEGCSLQDLADKATEMGLRIEAKYSESRAPQNITTPFVAHFDLPGDTDHFATVLKVGENDVHLVDGTSAIVTIMNKESFINGWSGYVLVSKGVKPVNFGTNSLYAIFGFAVAALTYYLFYFKR